MIETEQSVTIRESIDKVWLFARDVRGWAGLMPGMQDCDVIDDDNSRWTLKVGVGGMVRTVRVKVHVDRWDGPERVLFTYKLEGDPVQGGGSYAATAIGADETEVKLLARVEGSGPMAPMWEAMGRPLLPQFAKSFAGQLRDKIEAASTQTVTAETAAMGTAETGTATNQPATAMPKQMGLLAWLRGVWRTVFGKEERAT